MPEEASEANETDFEPIFKKRMNRRQAISTTAKVVTVAGIIAAAGVGTGAYYASKPTQITTQTQTQVQTSTVTQTPASKGPLLIVQWGGSYIDGTQPLANQFTKETGIPVRFELHTGGSAAVVARIKADLPDVTRDVVAAWNSPWGAMDKEGWLAPLTPDKIHGMNLMPESAKYKGPKSGAVVGLGWSYNEGAWFWREDLFPKDLQPMDNYEKLLDPRLKKKLAINDIVSGSGSIVHGFAYAFGGDEKNIEPGWQFLKKLAQTGNIGAVFSSEAENIQLATSGDAWALPMANPNAVKVSGQGIRVKRAFSKNTPNMINLEGFCVLNGPRLDLAYKWMDWFYTPDHVSQLVAVTGQPPLIQGAKAPAGLELFYAKPEDVDKYTYTPDYDYLAVHQEEWVKRFESEILPIIKSA